VHAILPTLIMAFKIWMVVDAIQRRAGYLWLMVIFFLPFGEWVYFFMVRHKAGPPTRIGRREDTRPTPLASPVDVASLRYTYEDSPSIHNQVVLAQALHDTDAFEEAAGHFSDVLRRRPKERACLFGLAHCHAAEGRPEEARDLLLRLVEQDASYLDYAPWTDLAEAWRQCGDQQEALTTLERLCRESPRISHKVQLADQLVGMERPEEARRVLVEGLTAYAAAPAHVKRAGRGPAAQAQQLLLGLPEAPSS